MASVRYENATRVFPKSDRPAVERFDLRIEDGEFLVLVGPSGCGKSTCLRMLAGLEPVDEGAVYIGERNVTNLPPKARDVAMVFQNYALYPHMTVAENMGFALKIAGLPRNEIRQRVAEAARILELEPYLDRKPRALSGGQRQRVAMGRAIVRQPQAFLMDEPLSNLDAKLRVQTRIEIASLQHRLGVTTVYVTHDQVEAMTMGHRVAVLNEGRLQQVDTPRRLYGRPANIFVASFIGSPAMNLCEAPLVDGAALLAGHQIPLPGNAVAAARREGAERVVLGFRPEAVELAANGEEGFLVTVVVVEELGADAYLHARLNGDGAVGAPDIVSRHEPRDLPGPADEVKLRVIPEELHVFSVTSGERLD